MNQIYIYATIEIIAKLFKLKVFNVCGRDVTEMVYERVNVMCKVEKSRKNQYDFLELFFKEMGYISS